MPSSAEETSWGTCHDSHKFSTPHQIWPVSVSDAQVLAKGDDWNLPYLAVKQHERGQFIYHATFQPLIAHGGIGPGMYAYAIFRRAIEWAFESAQRPVVKLSPWPYDYDAAFTVRHDLEHYVLEIFAGNHLGAGRSELRGQRGLLFLHRGNYERRGEY